MTWDYSCSIKWFHEAEQSSCGFFIAPSFMLSFTVTLCSTSCWPPCVSCWICLSSDSSHLLQLSTVADFFFTNIKRFPHPAVIILVIYLSGATLYGQKYADTWLSYQYTPYGFSTKLVWRLFWSWCLIPNQFFGEEPALSSLVHVCHQDFSGVDWEALMPGFGEG